MWKLAPSDVVLTPAAVLDAMGAANRSPNYDSMVAECALLLSQAKGLIRTAGLADFGMLPGVTRQKYLFLLLTLGSELTDYAHLLQQNGDCWGAAVHDTIADLTLFEWETQWLSQLRVQCRAEGIGIVRRLEPGRELPLAVQHDIVSQLHAGELLGLSVTQHGMLDPVKSMSCVFEVCDDEDRFYAAHSCNSCTDARCTMRKRRSSKENKDETNRNK